MLFSGFASPRRLVLLATALFFATIIVLQSTSYSTAYLPKYSIPGLSSGPGTKSSLEEDVQPPHKVERPSEDGLKLPEPKYSSSSAASTETWHSSSIISRPNTTKSDRPEVTSTLTSLPTHSPSASRLPISNTTSSESEQPAPDSYEQLQTKIQELVHAPDWIPPPIPDHFPPYDGYGDKDYDPNRWEGFEWDFDFYLKNGLEQLKQHKGVVGKPYRPYPAYNTPAWERDWKGVYIPCEGSRGKLLNQSHEDIVRSFPALPEDFPRPAIGDANATGVDLNNCFDRYNRFGPYGYGQAERESVNSWQRPIERPDWTSVHWGQLQDQCLVANKDRYASIARQPSSLTPGKELPKNNNQMPQDSAGRRPPKYHSRTAVLIRTWEGYDYTENDMHTIRAMITELSLLSGGEYQVFLLVNVKDQNADIFSNEHVYQDVLKQAVPREFRSITILFNEKLCEECYPKVGDWDVSWHPYMPMQWFSKTHPEFDFFWAWETDARYTGNYYELLNGVSRFAQQSPRKFSWERNQRYFVPAVHGSYEAFLEDTDETVERGIREGTVTPVWGPQPYDPARQSPIGPTPPTTSKSDQFQWGVGEDADLITFAPIFNPRYTQWEHQDLIWNYMPGIRPHFTEEEPKDRLFHHPEFANIPRRASVGSLVRFSRRQLHAMHLENTAGRTMQAEMWPATVALQHGLKAIYAPHLVWTDHKWPAWYLDAVVNSDSGRTAQWGDQTDSLYNEDRQHNMQGWSWSWYFEADFPRALYRRWLGWGNDGPAPIVNFEGKGFEEGFAFAFISDELGVQQIGGKGRMCLPPMLLHPVGRTVEDASAVDDKP